MGCFMRLARSRYSIWPIAWPTRSRKLFSRFLPPLLILRCKACKGGHTLEERTARLLLVPNPPDIRSSARSLVFCASRQPSKVLALFRWADMDGKAKRACMAQAVAATANGICTKDGREREGGKRERERAERS